MDEEADSDFVVDKDGAELSGSTAGAKTGGDGAVILEVGAQPLREAQGSVGKVTLCSRQLGGFDEEADSELRAVLGRARRRAEGHFSKAGAELEPASGQEELLGNQPDMLSAGHAPRAAGLAFTWDAHGHAFETQAAEVEDAVCAGKGSLCCGQVDVVDDGGGKLFGAADPDGRVTAALASLLMTRPKPPCRAGCPVICQNCRSQYCYEV